MKKTVLTLVLVSFLVVTSFFDVTRANPLPPVWLHPEMTVTIQSPQNGTYVALPVLVNFSAQLSNAFNYLTDTTDWVSAFFYVLDGQNMSSSGVKIEETELTGVDYASPYAYNYSGQTNLTGLTVGSHNITVYYGVFIKTSGFIVYNASWSATSQFYVKTGTSSPEPTAFPTNYTGVGLTETQIIIATAITVAIIVIGLGLLIYLIKRR